MSDAIKIAVMTALLNGAVTWGVVSTKLEWFQADLAKLEKRMDTLEARVHK